MFRLIRVIHILFHITRTGALWQAPGSAEKLCRALYLLGPSFVKMGQLMSVRPDIVGIELAQELTQLQDKVPPSPTAVARKSVERELGKPIEAVFTEFSDPAIAAASIAQVHKAKTLDGQDVAVKILRPNVEKSFQRDIAILYGLAKVLNRFKRFKRLKFIEVVQTLEKAVKTEMDFRLEAASGSELRERSVNDEGFYVPQIYWSMTSQSVLTMEWVNGIPINHKDELIAAGHDLKEIAKKLSCAFFNQSYRDGFFHADMHPGNLFVNPNGDIVPVDFGIMGRLNQETRLLVAEILRGFINADYEYVAEVHFQAGYVPANQSRGDFALACRAIGEPILGLPANQISIAKLLALLFKITEDFQMETQPQLLLFQKTMVMIEGVCQDLYPEVNLWQHAEPWIADWAKQNLGAKAHLKRSVQDITRLLKALPRTSARLDALLEYYIDKLDITIKSHHITPKQS